VKKVLVCLALGAAMTFGAAGVASAEAVVAVVNPPCTLVVDGAGCLFSGNINLTNKLLETETAYNAQTDPDIELTDLLKGEFDPSGDKFSGTITAPFLVSFYAVKGGNQFILYQITPTTTFSWNTNDLCVGNHGCNHPALSHVVYLGTEDTHEGGGGGPVPEPASWAMMLVGFGGMGAILRRTRRQARMTFA
jgi:hypothetical protein